MTDAPWLEPPVLARLEPALVDLLARAPRGDVAAALEFAGRLTADVPLPAGGRTAERWQILVHLGRTDLSTARILEAHLDAVAVLDEARAVGHPLPSWVDEPDAGWGVYAAEGAGLRLTATPVDRRGDRREQPAPDGSWLLDGVKPWCSLAGRLAHALVTAHTEEGRRLFAVRLSAPRITVQEGTWVSRGLTDVPSGAVTFDRVPAWPVGPVGWYLARPGFAHGGIGVAACWYGASVALAQSVLRSTRQRTPDQLAHWHLGAIDADLHAAGVTLGHAAREVDAGRASGVAGFLLSQRTRSVVAAAAEQVLHRAGHALGPAPLTQDDEHARRVADLTVYLRQHHAERDLAVLGRELADAVVPA